MIWGQKYLLLCFRESFPFSSNQGTNFSNLHVFHIARCESIDQEVVVWRPRLFDSSLILDLFEARLPSGLLCFLAQSATGSIGGLDFGWCVLTQPLLEGNIVLCLVFVGNVI